jgi:uncharacterized RDD family membrane protein YckC
VALDLDLAELGSRAGAYAIDFAVQLGLWIVFALATGITGALGLLGSNFPALLFIVAALVIFWGYFPFLEAIWNGRTIGKRALGLRAIQTDGQPAGLGPLLLRNLLRPLDMFIIGPVLMITSRRHQRLGDMAAGTIVVRASRGAPPAPVMFQYPPNPALPTLDTSGLTDQDYALIRSFLERRWQLDPGARVALAAQLAGMARAKVPGMEAAGMPAMWGPYQVNPDEAVLEATLASVRMRYQEPPGWSAPPPDLSPPPNLMQPPVPGPAEASPDAVGQDSAQESFPDYPNL